MSGGSPSTLPSEDGHRCRAGGSSSWPPPPPLLLPPQHQDQHQQLLLAPSGGGRTMAVRTTGTAHRRLGGCWCARMGAASGCQRQGSRHWR